MTTETLEIESVLEAVIKGFTRFHADLKITRTETAGKVFLNVTPHADDMPKLIGSGGCMIRAINDVMQEVSKNTGKEISVIVSEPDRGRKMPQDPYVFDSSFPAESMVPMVLKLAAHIWTCQVGCQLYNIAKDSTVIALSPESGSMEEHEHDRLERALSTIFHAIGKSHGRRIYIEVAS